MPRAKIPNNGDGNKSPVSYAERLKDPRWQRRRLEILNQADFACEACEAKDRTLHVHHKRYRKGAMPWEYADHELQALCETCHKEVEEWRELLTRLLVALTGSQLEQLIGFGEALFIADVVINHDAEIMNGKALAIRSYDHAYGVMRGLESGVRMRIVDRLCERGEVDSDDIRQLEADDWAAVLARWDTKA